VDPDDFTGRQGLRELDRRCRELAASGSIEDLETLRHLLLARADGMNEKIIEVPRIVAAAFISRGPAGVEELRRLIVDAPGIIYSAAIIETLWSASEGDLRPRSFFEIRYEPYDTPSDETRLAARSAFDDLVAQSQDDANLFHAVLDAAESAEIFSRSFPSADDNKAPLSSLSRGMMRAIRDSSILLTQNLIDEYVDLIRTSRPEAEYQRFLEEHPVFLDPLAAEMLPRARLGVELVTDFVLRRHDYRYLAVEIEKPQDPIFTQKNDFTREFSHAIGQVIDFQGWVADNVAYAQRHFPLIENPAGLLVIGCRSNLDDKQRAKLRRWCANSRTIEVLTFDDLAVRADALHRSIRRLPAQ
jgi:hypothetical protein